MSASPTQRTLRLLRRSHYHAGVVERFITRPGQHGIRMDFLGCIDICAVRRGEGGVLGVQATSASNMASRIKKAQGRPELRTWLASGNRWECWGWSKRGGKWSVKRIALRAEDLQPEVIVAPARRRGGKGCRQRSLFE